MMTIDIVLIVRLPRPRSQMPREESLKVGCGYDIQTSVAPKGLRCLPEQSDDLDDQTDCSEDQGKLCDGGALVPGFLLGGY